MSTVLHFKTTTHGPEEGAKTGDGLRDVNSPSSELIRKQYCGLQKDDSSYELRDPTDHEITCNDYCITG